MSHIAPKKRISRRTFLRDTTAAGFLFGLGILKKRPLFAGGEGSSGEQGISGASPPGREAMFYTSLSHRRVECGLCFRRCILHDGERGECRNRENRGGSLVSLVWGRPSAVHIDPVEKEPQHHFLPGTAILCFGTAGCNFHCRFCQNWQLSQRPVEEMESVFSLRPEEAVSEAVKRRIPTISFTYNEPTVFYEYMYDTAVCARKEGLHIIWHSNGAVNPGPLLKILPYTDAVTLDLKGFTEGFYRRYCEGALEPVLETLINIKEHGVWLEIVNLVIPAANDDPVDVRRMCRWIRSSLGAGVPLHFSRFFPAHRMTGHFPTPMDTLERCYEIARACGLHHVTLGNVPGHRYNSTYCPECGRILIKRVHFQVLENSISDGRCPDCGHRVPGRWTG